jgi:flagellar FliL protein
MMIKGLFQVTVLLCCSLIATVAHGARGDFGDTQYVQFGHPFVVNYGDPSLSRLRYLKVELQLRVESSEAAEQVEYHLPALRHALVMLFSKQMQQRVSVPEGKEEIRLEALGVVQEVMMREEGEEAIGDLLFTNFVVQR